MKHVKSNGIGAISAIMAILTQVTVGSHWFEIAMFLRETLFINSMLWNTETCYDLSKKEIKELELIDRMLLKRILEVPCSTHTALLYYL